MMRILVAPDKFKGSLTAQEVCAAIAIGIKKVFPSFEVIELPMADGGEGSLQLLTDTLQFDTHRLNVLDPLFQEISASYASKGDVAFVEMAQASGLQLLGHQERNCYNTSSYGTGQLIKEAITKGGKKITLFIGGSATNDGGIGMAAALGYKFYDRNGKTIHPIGANLIDIRDYSYEGIGLSDVSFTIASDVKNPLLGKLGATRVYGPQKGASNQELDQLEEGMENFAALIQTKTGKSIHDIPGSGAAGGMGAGAIAFLNAEIKSGISTIIDLLEVEKVIKIISLVVSGEGKMDSQTLSGKVIAGINELANKYHKPIGIICGQIDQEISDKTFRSMGIWGAFSVMNSKTDLAFAMANAFDLVVDRSSELIQKFVSEYQQ